MVAADARTAITFSLSPGHNHDAPEGRELLRMLKPVHSTVSMIMDRAYEGAKHGNWCWSWGLRRSCHPSRAVLTRGSTTESCIAVATK